MNLPFKTFFLLLIFSLLALFVFLTLSNSSGGNDSNFPEIGKMLPAELPGWKSRDLPVGETEEVVQKMGEILDYDAAFLREYKRGLASIHVYISYWTAGKAHFRSVYGHTPDVCWVQAGWRPTVQNGAYKIRLEERGFHLKTAQYREFVIGKEHLRVIFWQLLDGEPFTYGNFSYPPATAIFTDILTRGFNQKPEQWFIRISVNMDIETLHADVGFQELMGSLRNFGL